MTVRGKTAVKNPYGDDKGFAAPSARRRAPMSSEARKMQRLPRAKHYVRMVMDDQGRFHVDSSASMEEYQSQIVSDDIIAIFQEACKRHEEGANSEIPLVKPVSDSVSGSKRNSKKRRKSEQESSDRCDEAPIQMSLSARRKAGSMLAIRVSDTETIRGYYATCLRAFQQINCRLACKLWIKLIHPKKQVTNPYNGTQKDLNPDKRSSHKSDPENQLPKDPEKTKPRWWAQDVRHKEPDHLKKHERIALMVHLMERCGRDDNDFNEPVEIMQLFDEVVKKKPELHGGPSNDRDGRLLLIRDMCQLRESQKRWEDGEIDDDATVEVEGHEEHARKAEKEEAMREAKLEQKSKDTKLPDDLQALDLVEEPPMLTPSSSTASSAVYAQSFPHHDIEMHQSAPPCHSMGTFSPQSMASYHSVSATSPFHDMPMHQGMVFSQQPTYHAQAIEAQDHMSALGASFIPITRSEGLSPWTPNVPPTNHSYTGHVTSFADPSGSHPLQGMPLDDLGFNPQQYHGPSQDHDASAGCFPAVHQVDPRHLNLEPWKFRGIS